MVAYTCNPAFGTLGEKALEFEASLGLHRETLLGTKQNKPTKTNTILTALTACRETFLGCWKAGGVRTGVSTSHLSSSLFTPC